MRWKARIAKRALTCLLLLLLGGGAVLAQTYAADKAAADKALAAQDFPTAIAAFRKLVAEYPDKVEAYNALGFALYLDSEFDEAIATFEKALQISPNDDAARRNLILAGGRRALESSYRDGLNRIQALKERFPGHPQLAVLDFYSGKLHYLYGFTEPALQAWAAVARSRPKSGTALFLKAVQARQRGDQAAQNKMFQAALQQMPSEEVFRLWGARLMIEGNDPEQAAVLLTPLTERQHLSPGVAIALSRFERMRGHTLQAYELLKKTADVPEVLLERALMTQQMGASRETIAAELQKALDAGGEGALIMLSDEPGARVYLDGTLLGSPPLGLYPSPGEHQVRVLYDPRPSLLARFRPPSEGMMLMQSGSASGLDIRSVPSRGEILP
jgi:tetratricopeptide (TPR) repeat protein